MKESVVGLSRAFTTDSVCAASSSMENQKHYAPVGVHCWSSPSIKQRLKEIRKRQTFGHWELDMAVSTEEAI